MKIKNGAELVKYSRAWEEAKKFQQAPSDHNNLAAQVLGIF